MLFDCGWNPAQRAVPKPLFKGFVEVESLFIDGFGFREIICHI
jgi:hypothetical protein